MPSQQKLCAVIIIFVMISGCATSPTGFVDNAAHKTSVEIPANYQAVYREIVTSWTDCFSSPFVPVFNAGTHLTSNIYSDIERGEIVAYHGPFIDAVYRVEALGSNRSLVEMSGRSTPFYDGEAIRKMKKHLLGEEPLCDRVNNPVF